MRLLENTNNYSLVSYYATLSRTDEISGVHNNENNNENNWRKMEYISDPIYIRSEEFETKAFRKWCRYDNDDITLPEFYSWPLIHAVWNPSGVVWREHICKTLFSNPSSKVCTLGEA